MFSSGSISFCILQPVSTMATGDDGMDFPCAEFSNQHSNDDKRIEVLHHLNILNLGLISADI